MLGRRNPAAAIRGAFEPAAARLALEYDDAVLTPPHSPQRLVMAAMLGCKELLFSFTWPDEWPVDDPGSSISKRDGRKAAKYLSQALPTDAGGDALATLASGFGRATAATWRDAANEAADPDSAGSLSAGAEASERLARLVADLWPVQGYDAPLEAVRHAESARMYDLENPHALVDLQAYARRARVVAEALAVAMAARFEDFEAAILSPVYLYSLGHDTRTGWMWSRALTCWSNLLDDNPASHYEVMERLGAGSS